MALLPGFEHCPDERAEALAEADGRYLTRRMIDNLSNISLATREIEQNSPLFAGTDASPWVPLFQDPTFR